MAAKKKTDKGLVLGGEPRVELLPPEVGLRAKAAELRRRLALALVLSLVIVGVGYGLAWVVARSAEDRLAEAQQRTTQLITEQLKYAEVTQVSGASARIAQVREVGTSTEVLWRSVIDEIRSILPEGTTLSGVTAVGRAPWDPDLTVTGPLRAPRVATLTVVVTSPTVPDAAALVRALGKLTGYADASADSVVKEGEAYTTTITLNLDAEALSGRFAPADEQEPDGDGEDTADAENGAAEPGAEAGR